MRKPTRADFERADKQERKERRLSALEEAKEILALHDLGPKILARLDALPENEMRRLVMMASELEKKKISTFRGALRSYLRE
jgi:hypothetical protein